MMKQNRLKRFLAAALSAALLLCFCAPPLHAEGLISTPTLPDYFQKVLGNDYEGISCYVKRDDLGIEVRRAPADLTGYVRALTEMRLTAAPKGGKLEVKAPFTLRFTDGKRTDRFSFTAQGIRYNGALWMPREKAPLASLYEDDWEQFLSAEYFRLDKELPFTASEVASVALNRSHYDDSITMRLTGQAAIESLLAEHKQLLVRVLPAGETGPVAVGGSADETIYTLKNGSVWRLWGDLRVQMDGKPASSYQVLRTGSDGTVFDTLMGPVLDGVPSLSVTLNGRKLEPVYQTAFSYDGQVRRYENEVPIDYRYDRHIYLPIRRNTGLLRCTETPAKLAARLYRAEDGQRKEGRELAVAADGSITLPGDPGEYYLTVSAAFPKGTVEYFCGFIVSDLPEFFDSIEYGNNSGGVTITRDDLGRSVPGGQNRQYVNLLRDLNLVPDQAAPGQPVSTVKKPFTLTFRCKGYPDQRFQFKAGDGRVYVNGKPYRALNPTALARLYQPSDPLEGREGTLDDAKGFLTAEITTFGKLYPLQAQDVSAITVWEKKLYRRSVSVDDQGKVTYGFKLDDLSENKLRPSEFPAALQTLSKAMLAKETQNADSYDYGTYKAYEVTTRDGHRYLLDRRLTVDGKPSGYYIIPD